MTYNLEGTTSAVTGAASGIGLATAEHLARAGSYVVLLDRDGDAARRCAENIEAFGGKARGIHLDVSDEDAVGRTFSELKHLDIAVNNAGISVAPAPLADQSTSDWRRVMSVNLDGVFFCLRAQLGLMRSAGGGVITNVGSVLSAVASRSGSSAYVAAKHAVVGLTRSAAVNHAADNIRVNAIGPGYVETPMVQQALGAEVLAERALQHPIGRLGTPREIAALIAWLSSAEATFVTGAFYAIDGGFTAI